MRKQAEWGECGKDRTDGAAPVKHKRTNMMEIQVADSGCNDLKVTAAFRR